MGHEIKSTRRSDTRRGIRKISRAARRLNAKWADNGRDLLGFYVIVGTTVLDLATDSRREEMGGEGGVNPADECPAENLSRLGLPINDNRLLSRADYAMPPVSRHRVSAIDLFVDNDPFTRPSFPDFAFYNSIFSRWIEKRVINLTRFTSIYFS